VIIPSIDLMGGQAVQLVGGKEKVLEAGDPRPLAETFRLAGEIAVVDLDAALGQGDNTALIRELCRIAPCRVGGGIRDVKRARAWLDAGAQSVVLGTAAVPEVLAELPRERVVVALDCVDGEVVVDGWRKRTGRDVIERIAELEPYAGGFLVTFVEREGRMQGIDLARVEQVVSAVKGKARVTVAGGVTTLDEVAAIDRLGADAQVGMALYKGEMALADAIAAPLKTDHPDGLWATVICDERGTALGLAWSNLDSLRAAVDKRRGAYYSRSRKKLWIKGESSGAVQQLLRIDADCDRDALRFTVKQQDPGFCHEDTWTCWGPDQGLGVLARRLAQRAAQAPAGSYTQRLLNDSALLEAKLVEEAKELAQAEGTEHVTAEAADLIYFALVALSRSGVPLAEVERELDRRALKVSRRPGDAKPSTSAS
jgi:phosphoribosyl-ATP pyrophosphohydrolase/phosphoribosyl-AMP cyclohydrolase